LLINSAEAGSLRLPCHASKKLVCERARCSLAFPGSWHASETGLFSIPGDKSRHRQGLCQQKARILAISDAFWPIPGCLIQQIKQFLSFPMIF
ncbi:MAG: hypothetical protein PUE04_08115, partial [Lachnospira sp.]|nr:hypothetical protein [Lachnospira sp.]